jgi:hypothetical protein
MSGKQSSGKAKTSDVQKRGEANLRQKEARLEKKKASELTSMAKNHRSLVKNQRNRPNKLHRIDAADEIESQMIAPAKLPPQLALKNIPVMKLIGLGCVG